MTLNELVYFLFLFLIPIENGAWTYGLQMSALISHNCAFMSILSSLIQRCLIHECNLKLSLPSMGESGG